MAMAISPLHILCQIVLSKTDSGSETLAAEGNEPKPQTQWELPITGSEWQPNATVARCWGPTVSESRISGQGARPRVTGHSDRVFILATSATGPGPGRQPWLPHAGPVEWMLEVENKPITHSLTECIEHILTQDSGSLGVAVRPGHNILSCHHHHSMASWWESMLAVTMVLGHCVSQYARLPVPLCCYSRVWQWNCQTLLRWVPDWNHASSKIVRA